MRVRVRLYLTRTPTLTKPEGGKHAAATWSAMGGVSEAITDSFFTSVLGCKECAGRGDDD